MLRGWLLKSVLNGMPHEWQIFFERQLFFFVLLSCIVFLVVFIRSFGGQKNQKPRHTESPVCLFFAQELPVATSFGQKGIVSKFFLLVFGWCGTPSVSYRLQRHLTNSQTVLPLFPKTKRTLLVSFNGAGVSWTLPMCTEGVVWRSCGLAIRYPHKKSNPSLKAKRHR